MNYIMYGESRIEKSVFNRVRKGFDDNAVIRVTSDIELDEALKIVKFKPFFNNKWLLIVNLDKLDNEHYLKAIRLLTYDKVVCYYKLIKDRDRYNSLRKSPTINSLGGLVLLNAKFPSKDYVERLLLDGVKKVFDDAVIKYVYEEVKFNIDRIDEIIDMMNDFELNDITLKDMKVLLPKSKTKDIKSFCYCILLAYRGDLKELWQERDSKVLVSNAGTKKKVYTILQEINMKPEYLLNLITDILKNMVRVRKLYAQGSLTETNVFDMKEKLEKEHPFLKNLTIPAIREYIFVSREVTLNEIQYCLNEFLFLRQYSEITMDDIYFIVYRLMNRHNSVIKN